MNVTFWGAAREITGSMHLIELQDGFKILLDCGLYQGQREEMFEKNKSFPFEPSTINVVVLSHAHADHAGNLPNLVRHGFKGKIISTPATFDLCSYILSDSAQVNSNEVRRKKAKTPKANLYSLYDQEDVDTTLNLFHTALYDKWYELHPAVKLMFKDAGHILGSATVTLEVNENNNPIRLGFTGDIGTANRLVLRDPVAMPQVDYLISESTYGGRLHSRKETAEDALYRVFHEACIERKGKLIIPAFSLDRTQAVVFAFEKLCKAGKLDKVPVYVDSPLATSLTEVFHRYPECFDAEVIEYFDRKDSPFQFDNLTYIQSRDESRALNRIDGACVVISASGMGDGGRVMHHLKHNVGHENNTILIIGYCAEYTLGAKILRREPFLEIFGEKYPILAHTAQIDVFSAHADQKELLNFISFQDKKQLKKLFLVHGEYEEQQTFRDLLAQNQFANIEIPEKGQTFSLN